MSAAKPLPSLAASLADVARWWLYVVRVSVRDGWRWLPGPWWVKVLLLVLLAAGQLIPGELDEYLFLLLIGLIKRRVDSRRVQSSP